MKRNNANDNSINIPSNAALTTTTAGAVGNGGGVSVRIRPTYIIHSSTESATSSQQQQSSASTSVRTEGSSNNNPNNNAVNRQSVRAPQQQQQSSHREGGGGGSSNDVRTVKLLSRNDPPQSSQPLSSSTSAVPISDGNTINNNITSNISSTTVTAGLTIKPRKVVLPFPIGGDNNNNSTVNASNNNSDSSSNNNNVAVIGSDIERLQQQLNQSSQKLANVGNSNNNNNTNLIKQQQQPQDSIGRERREVQNSSSDNGRNTTSKNSNRGNTSSGVDARDDRKDKSSHAGSGGANRNIIHQQDSSLRSAAQSSQLQQQQSQQQQLQQQQLSRTSQPVSRSNNSERNANINNNNNNTSFTYHEKVKKIIKAGGVRRQGIVITIKGSASASAADNSSAAATEFGFIKPVDSPDEVYFRIKDVHFGNSSSGGGNNSSGSGNNRETKETMLGSALLQSILPATATTVNKVLEGDEISYFLVKESSKGGKLADRAILLELLPKGTVQLEVTLATSVRGWVIAAPRALPKEEPGKIKLMVPIATVPVSNSSGGGSSGSGNGKSGNNANTTNKNNTAGAAVVYVELWQRCLAEGVICRVGDELEFDIQRYRPENLLFARNVKVKVYLGLFREWGRVKRVVKDGGFAFVRSMNRSHDLYFRLSDVTSTTAATDAASSVVSSGNDTSPQPLQFKDIAIGTLLSFDVEADYSNNSNTDSSNNTGVRLKAIRVQLMQESTSLTSTSDFHVFRKISLHKIKGNLEGFVIRTAGEQQQRSSSSTTAVDMYKTYGHIEYHTDQAISTNMDIYPADARQGLDTLIQLFSSSFSSSSSSSSLLSWMSTVDVKELWIPNVTQSRITLLRRMLEEYNNTNNNKTNDGNNDNNTVNPVITLACEAESRGDCESSEGQALRVWRLSESEKDARMKQKMMEESVAVSAVSVLQQQQLDRLSSTSSSPVKSAMDVYSNSNIQTNNNILPTFSRTVFALIDIQDVLLTACPSLPLTGLTVNFDLCYDRLDNKNVANNIRVNKREYNPIMGTSASATMTNATTVTTTAALSNKKHRGVLECIRRVTMNSTSANNISINNNKNFHHYIGLIRQVYTRQVFLTILPLSPPQSSVMIGNNSIPTTAWEVGTLVCYSAAGSYSLWGGGVLIIAEQVEVELPPDVTATVARTWEKTATTTAVGNAVTAADNNLQHHQDNNNNAISGRCVGMVVAENQLVFIERCGNSNGSDSSSFDVNTLLSTTATAHPHHPHTAQEQAQRQAYEMQRISACYWNASHLRMNSNNNGFESVHTVASNRNKAAVSRNSMNGGSSATKGNANNNNASNNNSKADESLLDKQLLQLLSSQLQAVSSSSVLAEGSADKHWQHTKQPQLHQQQQQPITGTHVPSSNSSSPIKRQSPSPTPTTAADSAVTHSPEQIWKLLHPLCLAPPCIRDPVPIRNSNSNNISSTSNSTTNTTATTVGGGETNKGNSVTVGDLVYFTPVYDFSGIASNSLIAAVDPVKVVMITNTVDTPSTSVITAEAAATQKKNNNAKVKGLISRIDISLESAAGISAVTTALMNFTPWSSSSNSNNINNNYTTNNIRYATQLCEIRLVDSAMAVTATSSVAVALATTSQLAAEAIYYCDIREVNNCVSSFSSSSAHQSQKTNDGVGDNSNNNNNNNNTNNNTATHQPYQPQPLPKVGDMVEFYPINVTAPAVMTAVNIVGLAVGVQLLPPSFSSSSSNSMGSVSDGIHFRPRPVGGVLNNNINSSSAANTANSATGTVNTSASTINSNTGGTLGGSTMAQGPPDNNGDNIGFLSHWRPMKCSSAEEMRMKYSWGHLLVSSYSSGNNSNDNSSSGNVATGTAVHKTMKELTRGGGVSVLQVDAPAFTPTTAAAITTTNVAMQSSPVVEDKQQT